jgi:hypothetical protein
MNKILYIYGKLRVRNVIIKHVLNQFDELENAFSIYLSLLHLISNLA